MARQHLSILPVTLRTYNEDLLHPPKRCGYCPASRSLVIITAALTAYQINAGMFAVSFVFRNPEPGLTCLITADNAILEAQSRGKTGGLCDDGSAFNNYLQACNTCIDQNDVGSTDRSAIDSALAPYIEFCKATGATTAAADITSTITSIDASWLTMCTTLITTTLEAADGVGGESYLQTFLKPTMALSTLPGYFFHLSVGSIVSSYIPASVFSQLAYSVSLSAGAASVTGDATSLIYAALEATSLPSWFSAAVPATYSSQMHTLQEEINQLRATPISLAPGSTSEPTSLASSTPSTGE